MKKMLLLLAAVFAAAATALADTLINYGDAVYRFVNGESD